MIAYIVTTNGTAASREFNNLADAEDLRREYDEMGCDNVQIETVRDGDWTDDLDAEYEMFADEMEMWG